MREQAHWDAHAVFMNGLAAQGQVVLGGPVGTDGEILLIMNARTEGEAQALLDDDPWTSLGLLVVSRVREWVILLEALVNAAEGQNAVSEE